MKKGSQVADVLLSLTTEWLTEHPLLAQHMLREEAKEEFAKVAVYCNCDSDYLGNQMENLLSHFEKGGTSFKVQVNTPRVGATWALKLPNSTSFLYRILARSKEDHMITFRSRFLKGIGIHTKDLEGEIFIVFTKI